MVIRINRPSPIIVAGGGGLGLNQRATNVGIDLGALVSFFQQKKEREAKENILTSLVSGATPSAESKAPVPRQQPSGFLTELPIGTPDQPAPISGDPSDLPSVRPAKFPNLAILGGQDPEDLSRVLSSKAISDIIISSQSASEATKAAAELSKAKIAEEALKSHTVAPKPLNPGEQFVKNLNAQVVDGKIDIAQAQTELKDFKRQSATKVTTDVINEAEKSNILEEELFKFSGRELGKQIVDQKKLAQTAQKTITTIDNQLSLLDEGIFTGLLANVKKNVNKIFVELGFKPSGKLNATEVFLANTGSLVGNVLGSGQFGTGVGISDKDREFVELMQAGKITLDENSIRRVLNINRTAQQNLINIHNAQIAELFKGSDRFIRGFSVFPRDVTVIPGTSNTLNIPADDSDLDAREKAIRERRK